MRLRVEGELMVAGVRCAGCGQWFVVAEGCYLPWCCASAGRPAGLILEHRVASEGGEARPHPPADLPALDFFETVKP